MRIISFLSIIAALPSFFGMVHEKLYGPSQNITPDDSLFALLSKTERSFDNFLKNLTLLIGTSVLGMIADPPDAEEKAERLFFEFRESYEIFVSDFKALINCISVHKSTVQESFGSDWFRIENLKNAFENPGVDWNYISYKKTLICDSPILKNKRNFNSRLALKMKDFVSKELGADGFESFSLLSEFLDNSESLNPAAGYLIKLMSYSDNQKGEEE
jgi:hypothetical protein